MVEDSRRRARDGDRSLEALRTAQSALDRQLDELSEDIRRFFTDIRQEIRPLKRERSMATATTPHAWINPYLAEGDRRARLQETVGRNREQEPMATETTPHARFVPYTAKGDRRNMWLEEGPASFRRKSRDYEREVPSSARVKRGFPSIVVHGSGRTRERKVEFDHSKGQDIRPIIGALEEFNRSEEEEEEAQSDQPPSEEVLIKNTDTQVGRLVKVLAPDHPPSLASCMTLSPSPPGRPPASPPGPSALILVAATYTLPRHTCSALLCPLYPRSPSSLTTHPKTTPSSSAPTCLQTFFPFPLKVLLNGGQESLKSLFEVEEAEAVKAKRNENVYVVLVSWTNLPRYASHLRISFVKMPECGMLESLKGNSKIEVDDRQDMIDSALNDYFRIDRYLIRGDVFCVQIDWRCNSEMREAPNNLMYFKVVALEPLDEPTLRVNRNHTALVLGGSVASDIPPDFSLETSRKVMPLQGCGKRIDVRYIARRFGLHVVGYSCHDLTASSEKKAAAALANAFKSALRYSPCILLFSSFDKFGSLSANDGPSWDQVAITSEVASVIRDFTEPLPEDGYLLHPRQMDVSGLYFVEPERVSGHRILLVAAAGNIESLQPAIRRCFSHVIMMGSLSEEQRFEMLFQALKGFNTTNDENITQEFLKYIAGQTSGFMPRDISFMEFLLSLRFMDLLSQVEFAYIITIPPDLHRSPTLNISDILKYHPPDNAQSTLESSSPEAGEN